MGGRALIVLDTHAWVWWLARRSKLGRAAARSISRADRIGIPAIAVWEVANKAARGHIDLDRPYELWIDEALAADPRIEVLPPAPRISIEAARLSWDHRDPADRMIVATALVHGAPLVTSDETIHESGFVRCVWD